MPSGTQSTQRPRAGSRRPPASRPPRREDRGLFASIAAAGARSILVVLIMFAGSLVLWIGVPAAWLWIGSQVQAQTESLGISLGVTFLGAAASIAGMVFVLGWLNRVYTDMRQSHGLDPGPNPLEAVLVVTAVIAVALFGFWFLILAGPGPMFSPQ